MGAGATNKHALLQVLAAAVGRDQDCTRVISPWPLSPC